MVQTDWSVSTIPAGGRHDPWSLLGRRAAPWWAALADSGGVPAYLIVANRTLGGAALRAEVRQRIGSGAAEFYVVVPGYPDRQTAAARLADALASFRAMGAVVDGEVGAAHPVAAVHDALQQHNVDEILLSTLPAGISRWVANDTPSKLRRLFALPVVHIVSEEP